MDVGNLPKNTVTKEQSWFVNPGGQKLHNLHI